MFGRTFSLEVPSMTMGPAESFANHLLAALRARDPRAETLRARGRGRTAVIGVQDADNGFVPLLRLTGASRSNNVMTLLVRQGKHWMPTFQRGTPEQLAEPLATRLQHLWLIAVTMADFLDPREAREQIGTYAPSY